MAPRITALDWDSYKNRESVDPTLSRRVDGGVLKNEEDRLRASFDINRGSRDSEGYAGNDGQESTQIRMAIVPLLKSNPLTNPHENGSMDEATAARSTYQYFAGILEKGGQPALQMIRAAASEGNKAVQKAREITNTDNFTVVGSHTSSAQVVASFMSVALELAPPSREDAVKRPKQFSTGLEEKKLRDGSISVEQSVRETMKRAEREGWGNKEGMQVLPTDPSKVNFKAFAKAFAQLAEPKVEERLHPKAVEKLLHPDHLVRDTREGSDTFGQVVGLTPSLQGRVREQYHEAIVDHANSRARGASLPIPASAILSTKAPTVRAAEGGPKGVMLSDKTVSKTRVIFAEASNLEAAKKAVASAGADEEIIIGSMAKELGAVKTKARVSTISDPKSRGAYVLKKHGYSEEGAQFLAEKMQSINHATHAEFYLDADKPNRMLAFLAGHAATRGNLTHVQQGDEKLSLSQAQALGAAEFLTPAQMVRRSLADGLDVEVNEPAGAVALSLFRHNDAKIANRDIRAIQATGMHLQDVLGVAQDPNQARAFAVEHGVSQAALKILKEGDAAAVGSNLPHVLQELQGKGLSLIGPEDYPASMRHNPDVPPFAIVDGDVDHLRNLKGAIGITGDRLLAPKANATEEEKTAALRLASDVAETMTAIAATKQPRIWVDGQTPFPMEAGKNDVIIVSGSVGHEENASAGTRVSFGVVPSTVVYKAPTGRGKNAKGTQEMIRNEPSESQAPTAGKFLGQMADRLVVTNSDAAHYTASKTAVVEQLKQGKRVVAVPAQGHVKAATLNAALLRNDGHKALKDAAMGSATVEDPALKAVAGGPVAIRFNPRNAAVAAQGLADLAAGRPITKVSEKTAVKTAEDQR